MVYRQLLTAAASLVVVLGFIVAPMAWGLSTKEKADQTLKRVEVLELQAASDREVLRVMFQVTCQLLFIQLGPQTRRAPVACEAHRPLTAE